MKKSEKIWKQDQDSLFETLSCKQDTKDKLKIKMEWEGTKLDEERMKAWKQNRKRMNRESRQDEGMKTMDNEKKKYEYEEKVENGMKKGYKQ